MNKSMNGNVSEFVLVLLEKLEDTCDWEISRYYLKYVPASIKLWIANDKAFLHARVDDIEVSPFSDTEKDLIWNKIKERVVEGQKRENTKENTKIKRLEEKAIEEMHQQNRLTNLINKRE